MAAGEMDGNGPIDPSPNRDIRLVDLRMGIGPFA